MAVDAFDRHLGNLALRLQERIPADGRAALVEMLPGIPLDTSGPRDGQLEPTPPEEHFRRGMAARQRGWR